MSPDIDLLDSAQLHIFILDEKVYIYKTISFSMDLVNRFKGIHVCICLYMHV